MIPGSTVRTALLSCLMLCVGQPSAWAEKYRHHTLPALQDYVITLEAEDEKTPEFYSTGRAKLSTGKGGEYLYGNASMHVDGAGFIGLTLEVYEEDITIEDWLEAERILHEFVAKNSPDDSMLRKVHSSGHNELLGQKTFFRYVSPLTDFVDGEWEKRSFRNPMGKEVMTVFDGHVRVALRFMDDVGVREKAKQMNPALEKALDHTAESLEIKFEELFESFRETEHFATKRNVLSFNPILSALVSMDVPVDWIASDDGSHYPGYDNRQILGKTAIKVEHYDPSMFKGSPPRLFLVVEALSADKLSSRTYKKHGREFLDGYLESAREIDSSDVTDYFFSSDSRYAHCVSMGGEKVNPSSGGIEATTYNGKDKKGNKVMAIHYSGGGSNLACNYLYMADPETFMQTLGSIETLLHSVKVELLGKWHAR